MAEKKYLVVQESGAQMVSQRPTDNEGAVVLEVAGDTTPDSAESEAPSPELPVSDALVVHQLDRILDASSDAILVVGFGFPMKAAVRACVQNKCKNLWVTGTEDKKRGFSCSGAANVAVLGPKFDEKLFSNEYALLQAAKESGAKSLLVVNEQAAKSDLLKVIAAQEGLRLFTPLETDKTHQLWVQVDISDEIEDYAQNPIEWGTCSVCKLTHDKRQVLSNYGTCPSCGGLYRLNSDERIAETFDSGSFEEWNTDVAEANPLNFPDYDSILAKNRTKSGRDEAVRTGKARLAGISVAVCIMESSFMMGSMGTVVGEKITRTVERATAERLPLIIFSASGGARMQEGLASLMQMAKISAALERHSRAGLLYISVITDPTTGGVTASFATLGDIIVAEPRALIGFAGRRVIQDTIRQTLPEEFQTAEFALEHGLIDAIVERRDMRAYLANVVALHLASINERDRKKGLSCGSTVYSYGTLTEQLNSTVTVHPKVLRSLTEDEEQAKAPKQSLWGKISSAFGGDSSRGGDASASIRRALNKRGVADAPSIKPLKDGSSDANPAWESVLLARNVHRPTAQYYIDYMIDGFEELHGDRAFADDGAILAGIGWLEGTPVTILAEEKGADLQQRIKRNFGCPQPEGYRKTMRLMKQAEKFGRPIVCLVDTQGAFCGMEAEERGQGNAIAENLAAMSDLTVPVVCIVLGEGGSGGALALAVGNRVAMQEHAVYSVLSPEGFASILWKDRSRAPEAAAVMKMSAAEACEMGLIDEVVSEGDAPAHENPEQAAALVEEFVIRSLHELESLSEDELREQRYNRFRAF